MYSIRHHSYPLSCLRSFGPAWKSSADSHKRAHFRAEPSGSDWRAQSRCQADCHGAVRAVSDWRARCQTSWQLELTRMVPGRAGGIWLTGTVPDPETGGLWLRLINAHVARLALTDAQGVGPAGSDWRLLPGRNPGRLTDAHVAGPACKRIEQLSIYTIASNLSISCLHYVNYYQISKLFIPFLVLCFVF